VFEQIKDSNSSALSASVGQGQFVIKVPDPEMLADSEGKESRETIAILRIFQKVEHGASRGRGTGLKLSQADLEVPKRALPLIRRKSYRETETRIPGKFGQSVR